MVYLLLLPLPAVVVSTRQKTVCAGQHVCKQVYKRHYDTAAVSVQQYYRMQFLYSVYGAVLTAVLLLLCLLFIPLSALVVLCGVSARQKTGCTGQ